MRVTVSAQSGAPDTRAGLVPQKAVGDGKTVPIIVTTRAFDKKALLSAPTLTDEEQTGRALWVQRCAYCHDGVGGPSYNTMGPWLGAETIQKFGEDTVRNFTLNGDVRMPAFRYQLDAQQLNDLIAFIKTVPSSEKPTAAQLAGRVAAPENTE